MTDIKRLTAREASGDPRAHGARVGRSAPGITARSGHRNEGFAAPEYRYKAPVQS